nr:MAG TPA: hypothetical protein [Caudoviricetes sp.]
MYHLQRNRFLGNIYSIGKSLAHKKRERQIQLLGEVDCGEDLTFYSVL